MTHDYIQIFSLELNQSGISTVPNAQVSPVSFSSGDGFRGEQGHRRDLGGGLFPEGLGTWDVMVGFYILQASRAGVGES